MGKEARRDARGEAEIGVDELARRLTEAARQLSDGEVPRGRRWQHTYDLHRLAGRLLIATEDDRGQTPRLADRLRRRRYT
jgi:hypothetical protein